MPQTEEGKRLWVATVSFEFVVLAGDESEAMEVANEHVREDLENHSGRTRPVDSVRPVSALDSLPGEWDGDCIPWGSEDDRTCAEVFAGENRPSECVTCGGPLSAESKCEFCIGYEADAGAMEALQDDWGDDEDGDELADAVTDTDAEAAGQLPLTLVTERTA